ncbi:branched-chain-amino-acid aminotransferase, cytosolic [Larimichthys crocea]|uniref:branched-chain-amino-acid aminotransferase, cytosolic n=1 Tax=Larimichthys crocea TaxID=215358 RepID=UPI000F603B1C|nr:branched-chain-amino-acid aminotransferase, cytosolic [Larimichthys crocea]
MFGQLSCLTRRSTRTQAADLVIQLSSTPKAKPDVSNFRTVFTDHMLTIDWNAVDGWQAPLIKPFRNLSLHPSSSSLHYGVQLIKGLKACRGDDGRPLFRPMLNMNRMSNSVKRACLPAFDQSELLECIRQLVEVDQDWVSHSDSANLYIRPKFIAIEPTLGLKKPTYALLYVILCQVGPYFNNQRLSMWADLKYTRAWKGGTGDCKMGGCVVKHCMHFYKLYQISEAGTMNIFLHWINEDGEEELATPPLDGIILPGVTILSISLCSLQYKAKPNI